MEPEHTKYDLKRLSEDLTYCFYLAQDGREIGYIPDLIKVLNDFEPNLIVYNPEDPLQFSEPEEEQERWNLAILLLKHWGLDRGLL